MGSWRDHRGRRGRGRGEVDDEATDDEGAVDGTEIVVVAAATVVAVGPAPIRSMTKSRTPRTITAANSSRLESTVCALPAAQALIHQVEGPVGLLAGRDDGGMKRITLASGPLMMISSRS